MRLRLGRWLRSRGWGRLFARVNLPRWWPFALLALLAPIATINIAVAWVGRCAVFPLSPFFIRNKVQALDAYSRHRPRCLLFGDDTVSTEMIARTEVRNHLPCGLLGAVVQVESGGRAHSISSAGAMGPLQLIPSTALALGVSDPFDPEESLDGAGRYLHAQLVTFHDTRLAAAAYNAGPGRSSTAPSRTTARPSSTSPA